MKKFQFALLLCSALASVNVMALGDDGHKTVGAIADRLLIGTNAETRVKALLLPGESLQSVSIWADCVKGSYCGPQTPEMITYAAQNPAHFTYHYINLPVQNTAYAPDAVGTTEHDIVRTLQQCIAVLQGNDTDASNPQHFTQRQALLLIAHLVGDIHQPLHVGAAYINKDMQFVTPASKQQVDGINIFDLQGGNNLLLEDKNTWTTRDLESYKRDEELAKAAAPAEAPKRVGKPLHLFWDVTVVENLMRNFKVKSVAEITDKIMQDKPGVSLNSGNPGTWPEQWANDSLALAKFAYADIVATDRIKMTNRKGIEYSSWYVRLPDNYIEKSTEMTRNQIANAGYHLAALLNKIWP
ncbi:MAG: S1/P1 nuclease [Pseudomonadota bacterium]